MRVLVFGDSITQGYWALERGWVERVKKHYDELAYRDLEHDIQPGVMNVGISADTTENILKRIESEVIARTWHEDKVNPIVVLQIGTNDSCKLSGRRMVEPDKYANNLKKIIQKTQKICSKIVLVGFTSCDEAKTRPVFWGDFYWSNDDIKQYENIMAEVAKNNEIGFIPVFDKFKAQIDAGADLLADGLHPNDDGHKNMYEIIMPKLQEMIG